MIPSFDHRLEHNFNYLMYANDIILISKAFRMVAKNIKLCLFIYSNLTSQKLKFSKSVVYFPSWLNRKLTRSIYNALEFNVVTFPFTDLSVIISPGRLYTFNFKQMVFKANNITAFWKHQHISLAGRVILINSVLMSILVYTLAVQHIPDSILEL